MTFRIALGFEDGVTRFIDCKPSESVADAAYRAGINIPLDCRDGACGTCKSVCESGRFDPGQPLDEALSPEEAAEGYVLTCQMKPQSDCVVRIAAASAACKVRPAATGATLTAVEALSPTTLRFELAPDGGADLAFLPGQYANIGVPGTAETRAYSFASLSRNGRVDFVVRNIPGGLMSGWLASSAKAGDRVTLTGPFGSFYLRPLVRPALMLAGGTGLAPFIAMLERLLETGFTHPVRLVCGVTGPADLVLTERLADIAARAPAFSFITVVADAASGHPRTGYVTQHLEDADFHGGDVDIYLCGPPPMVDAVRADLHRRAITPASFHTEKFAPGTEAKAA